MFFFLTCLGSVLRGRAVPLGTRFVSEVPETPSSGLVYFVGEGEHRWFAVFCCPCRCGALVELSTLSEGRPRWSVKEHWNGTATLRPSVRRTTGCRSHFFVRRGQVVWV